MGVEARVVLKETKGKATVDLATCQAFKECNKCWADNNPEGCWYPMGTPPCFSNAPDPMVEKTYHRAVLVRRVKKSLALLTHQGDEERGSGKGKQKADKGKKRVRVVSLAAVTPEVESEEDDEDEACHLSAAIEATGCVLGEDEGMGCPNGKALEAGEEGGMDGVDGLVLQYSTLRWKMLRDYQEDVMRVLEWQEENNVQEGDLLPLRDTSLPSDDD
ncbi:hypothetical protein C0993_008578 [Termitomyces sp. T159_Od127]|nr:hypothetical protein C0993_008578 [Termitomyces sp. T159_Od127]